MVALKYLSNLWGTLEVLSINCEINLILTWSVNSAILSGVVANEGTTFEITYKISCPGSNFIVSW